MRSNEFCVIISFLVHVSIWLASCECLFLCHLSEMILCLAENFMTGYQIVFDRENFKLGWSRSNCECPDFSVISLWYHAISIARLCFASSAVNVPSSTKSSYLYSSDAFFRCTSSKMCLFGFNSTNEIYVGTQHLEKEKTFTKMHTISRSGLAPQGASA